jgi:L-amino acid N-acyltransferase YncA
MLVRDATVDDLDAVRAIYNALFDTTTIAWTEEEQTAEQRLAWFARQTERGFPVLVACDGDEVVGFAAYGDFRGAGKWLGYRFTVEHTIHVRAGHWGNGVGRLLLSALIGRARAQGMHAMIAAIDGENDGSMRFHERLGFVEVGRLPEVGLKFGRWLDLVLMQLIVTPGPAPR